MWNRYASLLPHACQPAAPTANYGAVQAAVSDFPKNAGRCPKKCKVKPYLSFAMFPEKLGLGLPTCGTARGVGFQLNDFFKKIIQSLLKALTR
jgi:hypothetical protein